MKNKLSVHGTCWKLTHSFMAWAEKHLSKISIIRLAAFPEDPYVSY
jgi:hypothetical protein